MYVTRYAVCDQICTPQLLLNQAQEVEWVDTWGWINEFGIAPYKSKLHVGDGFEADELLQNAWLKNNGHISKRGQGISRQNPAIALEPDMHRRIT
ncbi:hypothetical protein [Pelistega sp. MC2]|uniref:hypothetical protein n=1 Tax=Pelistega sp. MC2 TaxID=1720297 RepID=UPI0008D988B7|nr:hypothetical protein [Pelistega sp. MC2]